MDYYQFKILYFSSFLSSFDINLRNDIFFKAQIKYRDPDGNVAARVITAEREQTEEKERAVKDADVRVLGTFAAQNVPKLQAKGKFAKAKKMLVACQDMNDQQSGAEAVAMQQEYGAMRSSNMMMAQKCMPKAAAYGGGGGGGGFNPYQVNAMSNANVDEEDEQQMQMPQMAQMNISNMAPPKPQSMQQKRRPQKMSKGAPMQPGAPAPSSMAPSAAMAAPMPMSRASAAPAADAEQDLDERQVRNEISDQDAAKMFKSKKSSYI